MANNTLTTEEGAIEKNLRADIMRNCMENKNLLTEEGSIYVGTGESGASFTVDGVTYSVPKTTALVKGDANTVLCVDSGSNLGYGKITPSMVENSGVYDIICESALECEHTKEAEQATIAETAVYPARLISEDFWMADSTYGTIYEALTGINNTLVEDSVKISQLENQCKIIPLSRRASLLKNNEGEADKYIGICEVLGGISSDNFSSSCRTNRVFVNINIKFFAQSDERTTFNEMKNFYLSRTFAESVGVMISSNKYYPKEDIKFYFYSPSLEFEAGSTEIFLEQPLVIEGTITTTGYINLRSVACPKFTNRGDSEVTFLVGGVQESDFLIKVGYSI